MQAVADKGYPATTVADVVERAGVSRKTFYEQFPDREACFLAAYDAGVEYVLGRLAEAGADLDGDWRERLRSNIEYLPVRARGMSRRWPGRCTVQVLSAGRRRARAPGPGLRGLLRSGPAASTSCGPEPRTGPAGAARRGVPAPQRGRRRDGAGMPAHPRGRGAAGARRAGRAVHDRPLRRCGVMRRAVALLARSRACASRARCARALRRTRPRRSMRARTRSTRRRPGTGEGQPGLGAALTRGHDPDRRRHAAP